MIKISSFLRRVGILKRRRPMSDERWRIDMDDLGGAVGRIVTEPMRLPGGAPRARPTQAARPGAPQRQMPPQMPPSNPAPAQRAPDLAPVREAPPARPAVLREANRDMPRDMPRPQNAGQYLAVQGVEKSFGTRKVVKGVSLYVRGEAVGLLGPNGAGKTTVFYMITGLIAADRGRVELDGHDVTKLPMYQRARLGIGYLPQEASIFRGLTVEENIRAVLEVVEPSRKKRERQLDELLEEFHITRLRKTPSIALSGEYRSTDRTTSDVWPKRSTRPSLCWWRVGFQERS